MNEVISFPTRSVSAEKALEEIPDIQANHERNDQGPPIGSSAYRCECECFAFYFTPADTRCYECHAVHTF